MIFLIFGSGSSFGISGAFVYSNSSKENVGLLMVVECILSLIALALTFFLFKNKPVLHNPQRNQTNNIKSELISLLHNKNYLYLLTASSSAIGTVNYLSVVLELITDSFDYSTQEASIIGVCVILSGLVGCLLASVLSTVLHKYKIICIGSVACAIALLAINYLTLDLENFATVIVAACLLGLALMPVYPLSMELSCEIGFPVREIVASGFINCFGQIFSLIPIGIAYGMGNTAFSAIVIAIICEGVSLLFYSFIKEDLMRTKAEKQNLIISESRELEE